MLKRLHTVWLCVPLLCSCSLDSTPRAGANDSQHSERGAGWKPPESNSGPLADGGSALDGAADRDSGNKAAQGGAHAVDAKPQHNDPAPTMSPDAGAVGPSMTSMSVMADPSAAASGGTSPGASAGASGGATGAAAAAGAAGAAGAEAKSLREMFIDAAIDALGGDSGGNQDGGMEPWRRSGGTAGGLSPDFVLPVLLTMKSSAVCFRDVRRCVEMCLVLASDCKPCATDPECGQALKDVCGPTIGSCGSP